LGDLRIHNVGSGRVQRLYSLCNFCDIPWPENIGSEKERNNGGGGTCGVQFAISAMFMVA